MKKKCILPTLDRKEVLEKQKEASKERKRLFADFISKNKGHIANYFKGIPNVFKWGWFQSYFKKHGPSGAIKAKCFDCAGYSREEVYNCTVRTCPLWNYRPQPKKDKHEPNTL